MSEPATNQRSERFVCDCGQSFSAEVVRVINTQTHPELLAAYLAGKLNTLRCLSCGRELAAETPVQVHDPALKLYVCSFPSAWRSRELSLRIEFYQELLDRGAGSVPGYVRDARFVFSLQACARLLGQKGEIASTGLPAAVLPAVQAPPAPAPPARGPEVREIEERDFEQVFDVKRLERRDDALVQRWKESGQDYYAFWDEGALHLFQLHADPESFGERADIFFQLHRIENFPLIVLLLVAPSHRGGQVVLYWLFNLDNPVDVKFVEQLARHFEISLHLFDHAFVRRRTLGFSPQLEQNVAYVLEEARRWLNQIDPKRRNFFIAASKFNDKAYEKLGRGRAGLNAQAFRELPTPTVTKLALDILTFWSLRENYEYLIFIKSFPVTSFKAILAAVLARAIYFGLALTEKMKRIAVEMGLAMSDRELVQLLLSNFAEVSVGVRPCDMDWIGQWDNWQHLLGDAAEGSLEVDPQIAELANVARRKAEEGERAIPLDLSDEIETFGALSQLGAGELVDLLGDRENRAEAVRALAEQGRDEALPQVFVALRRMTRREVERLGDALGQFGEAARPLLLESLRVGKGPQVLGALRGLIHLDGARAVGHLVEVVRTGPRWLVGDLAELAAGLPEAAVPELIRASREAAPEVRRRMVAVLRGLAVEVARARLVEMAAGDGDRQVVRLAKAALRPR